MTDLAKTTPENPTPNCPHCADKQALIDSLRANLDAVLIGATRMTQLLDESSGT